VEWGPAACHNARTLQKWYYLPTRVEGLVNEVKACQTGAAGARYEAPKGAKKRYGVLI